MGKLKDDYGRVKPINEILLESRIIQINGEVNTDMANYVCAALLILNAENKNPIQMFINSPGGSVVDGLAIIDTMNFIQAPVYTICTGMAASMGAAILSCGEKGNRIALPNSTVMIHQVSSGTQGFIKDQKISLAYSEALNDKLLDMLSKNCGQDIEKIRNDTDRDNYMFADVALEYGIIDKISTNL